jgi:hypothetical protein
MLNKSNVLENEDQWKEYRAFLDKKFDVRDTDNPESYPCVCIHGGEYDSRWNSYREVYEFVYAREFIS